MHYLDKFNQYFAINLSVANSFGAFRLPRLNAGKDLRHVEVVLYNLIFKHKIITDI